MRRTNLQAIGAFAGAAILLAIVVGPMVVKHGSAHAALDVGLARAASPTTTQSPSPDPVPTATPSPTKSAPAHPKSTPTLASHGAGCKVVYALKGGWGGAWPGAFSATITVYNTSSTQISGWSLKWTYPSDQVILAVWNGSFTQRGSIVIVTNVGYNAAIPTNGGSVTVGFLGTSKTNASTKPTHVTLNATSCAVG